MKQLSVFRRLSLEKKIYKRRRLTRKRRKTKYHYSAQIKKKTILKTPILTPKDFRFVENPLPALVFFNSIRDKNSISLKNGIPTVRISFKKTEKIDFATISILKGIFEESKYNGINFQSNMPKHEKCRQYLIDTGFFNKMYDEKLREINITGKGKYFSIEKKEGKLTIKDLKSFDEISCQAFHHIMGKEGYSDESITLLKEIGGNAVEWSNSYNNQWQIGVFYKANSVVFTVSDLGRGIRDSLYVSRKLKAIDFFFSRNDLDIIERAFERRYGSLSQEINRNRGLPSIKRAYDDNKITKLVVCTNNVFLNFENKSKSILLNKKYVHFLGTFYQWELNKTCFN
ncbi:hypothetical protein [Flavobacterium aquidurense]|uniref:Uncharacterized protein n=1 Tax=Flavobacterium aquidurense TaxID=362413 RepID=A0A0Q1B9T2_9FLAO|nr:hypothetical protein [Flavobacterium aquidurense]KQB37105.1 hypothetical protein RC62_2271 [Flavobacterium aquidurense]